MQAGVFGGICLLTFLLSVGKAEDSDILKDSKVLQGADKAKDDVGLRKNGDLEGASDLKSELGLGVTQTNSQPDEGRSGDVAQSDARRDSAVSNAVAHSSGEDYASAYAESSADSGWSKATAVAGGAPASPFNPFNEELGPYIPSRSSYSQAEAKAINVDPYGQGLNSYPYPGSYPYNQGLSPSQTQNQADKGLYQPGYNVPTNVNPYYQGSSYPQVPSQSDSESNNPIVEPISMLPKPVFSSSYHNTPESSTSSAHAQDISELYKPLPVPNPDFLPYERFLVPYKEPGSTQIQGNYEPYQPVAIIKPKQERYETNPRAYSQGPNSPYGVASSYQYSQKEPYREIPLHDSFLVPYRDPNPPQTLTDTEEYQPIPIPKSSNTHQEALARLYSERFYSSQSNGVNHKSPQLFSQNNNGAYETLSIPNNSLRTNPTQDKINPNQDISIPESDPSRYEPSTVQFRERNSQTIKLEEDSNLNVNETKSDASLSSTYTAASRSREYNPVEDDINSNVDIISKTGWDPYKHNPYTPSRAYHQLYPSGAEAAQTYPDRKPAASGAGTPYSQGISAYANDYPSESPVRLESYSLLENKPQGTSNMIFSGKSSPIAFEDARSRAITPHEYVFPNKMPGGENSIKCTKENEFHHFWSQQLNCLVCICLNEYGILQPVCASCAGCDNPPPELPVPVPRLPESITAQPATSGPFEPIPMMPEPNPEQPIKEPIQHTPEPYPVYPTPEPATSPVPVIFPEPVATLPPPSETAHCNPLPTGVPFTNPLHPCQLCICRESRMTGKSDLQIECKENPQCIAPADVTALPPIPDVPMPIPLPICEKFPENVLFPHPTESCKLCKCAKSLSERGDYEQQITCYPHPDCVPKLEAVTESVPPLPIPVDPYQVKPSPVTEPPLTEPLREPYEPMEPVPLPELVTAEPLPWPPLTTIAPATALPLTPKPGPLPGPSPHESCRPYPPNQTFQHPWDECQLCVCTEAIAVSMITVEVNCYTKPSCCIEPPDSVKGALPGKLPLCLGFNLPYPGLSNTASSPDVQALSSGSQPITSTYRTPSAYPSYSPKSVNIYPGSNQPVDPLSQPPVASYSGFVDPSSSYPYQPNYSPQFVNPQYSEYPPRLPVLPGTGNAIAQYKPNNFGYPANYHYAQGDAVGSNYPTQGHYQPFDPRYQTIPAPSYPGMYQRAYERPPMFAATQLRESYVKPPVPAMGGPSLQNLPPSYAAPMGYSKSGKEEPDNVSR